LVLAGLAYRLSGVVGLEGLSIAALLSLVPGWLVFWGVAAASQSSDQKNQSMAVLAATCVRLMFVLFGVLLMKSVRPDLGLKEFHIWVIAFYGVSLMVETVLLVKSLPKTGSVGDESMKAKADLVSAS
jgi:peptidoglycan/LPS O-acetylase OafA/YrhL